MVCRPPFPRVRLTCLGADKDVGSSKVAGRTPPCTAGFHSLDYTARRGSLKTTLIASRNPRGVFCKNPRCVALPSENGNSNFDLSESFAHCGGRRGRRPRPASFEKLDQTFSYRVLLNFASFCDGETHSVFPSACPKRQKNASILLPLAAQVNRSFSCREGTKMTISRTMLRKFLEVLEPSFKKVPTSPVTPR